VITVKRVGMVRVGLYFSEFQVKRIKVIAKKKGLTASEIVRRMIDEGLDKYERPIEKK
jgi:hypothetical protein